MDDKQIDEKRIEQKDKIEETREKVESLEEKNFQEISPEMKEFQKLLNDFDKKEITENKHNEEKNHKENLNIKVIKKMNEYYENIEKELIRENNPEDREKLEAIKKEIQKNKEILEQVYSVKDKKEVKEEIKEEIKPVSHPQETNIEVKENSGIKQKFADFDLPQD